jgi:hypothetical protein
MIDDPATPLIFTARVGDESQAELCAKVLSPEVCRAIEEAWVGCSVTRLRGSLMVQVPRDSKWLIPAAGSPPSSEDGWFADLVYFWLNWV